VTTKEEHNETEIDALGGVKIVDCDAHFTEPPDLWSSRVPAAWKDRMPEQRTVDEVTYWYVDGEKWASTGGNTIGKVREKKLGTHVLHPFSEIDESAYSVPERLVLMDEMGVAAQIIYPNGVGFASNHVFAIEDIEQRRVVLQTYNDFYADIQEESAERLLPQAMLPIWDMDLTVKEMERLIARGIRGFTLSDRPELLGLPELNDEYFAPMWDLFNESGAVANFHIAAGNRREATEAIRAGKATLTPGEIPTVAPAAWTSFGRMRQMAVSASQAYMSNVRIVANLCMSDMFDRYPKLKVVSAESGIGWVPFLLEALEYQLDEMVTNPDERSLQKKRPTEYFREHLYVMFWFESFAPATSIPVIGVENVLVETDVPHPTCYYPGAREHFAKVLSGLDAHTIRRVLRDNAAELYHVALS
jgi:predicted TIM-barrel fold metal-dependent hydrolase